MCSRFGRTRETAELALAGRDVPIEVDERLDDIKIGDLEGEPIARYREVKHGLGRKQPFPGGECLDDAARRYAAAFRDLVAREVERVLVVCHEIPVRYALNAAAGSDALDGPPFHDLPNAVPFLFDGERWPGRPRGSRSSRRSTRRMDDEGRRGRLRSSCSAGSSACLPASRPRGEAAGKRRTPVGLAAFERAPCYEETLERERTSSRT